MGSQTQKFVGILVFMAGLCSAKGLTGSPPLLSEPVWDGAQFQFTLRGQTNVSYVIEWSSNLLAWVPAATNSDAHATRLIMLPAPPVARFWRVRRPPSPAFEYAIAARSRVLLGGSGRIDSFNSTNTLESTVGLYDSSKATDRARIGCASPATNAVNIGNVKVYGYVSTEPSGTVTLGPNGGVGNTLWFINFAGTIQPGHHSEDMNFAFANATLPAPFGPIFPLGGGIVGGTNYTYVLSDHDYMVSSISLSATQKMIVIGKARIYVAGTTLVSGSAYVVISPGASLEWYARGTVDWSGGGCINSAGLAKDFSIIGLVGPAANIRYSGSASFIGTIYAPTASVVLTGSSDATGSLVGHTVELSGGMGLHFDESLKSVGPSF